MPKCFEVLPFRFRFLTRAEVLFPPSGPANTYRGALGLILRRLACIPDCPGPRACPLRQTCPYARIFEPGGSGGPSGLKSWPRPFVIRAHDPHRLRIAQGEDFGFDLHLFDVHTPLVSHFVESFRLMAEEGLGRGRGTAFLSSVELLDETGSPRRRVYEGSTLLTDPPHEPVLVDLSPSLAPVNRMVVRFVTPTELKGGEDLLEPPEFSRLLARARDRVATLCSLYGAGPLGIDFKGLGERAARVGMVHSSSRRVRAERRSSKTGQVHPIGGFTGEAEYEGDLGEFLPYLQAARWTGVGRQTTWGKGAIEIEARTAAH